jgi:hypothetical protein
MRQWWNDLMLYIRRLLIVALHQSHLQGGGVMRQWWNDLMLYIRRLLTTPKG